MTTDRSPQRVRWHHYAQTYNDMPLRLRYNNLSTTAEYRFGIVYAFAGFDARPPSKLTVFGSGGHSALLHDFLPAPTPTVRQWFDIPPALSAGGELLVQCNQQPGNPTGGPARGCQISEVWLSLKPSSQRAIKLDDAFAMDLPGARLGFSATGVVHMMRNASTYNSSWTSQSAIRWMVLTPEGVLDTAGDPCEGLQAALTHATEFGYDVRVDGGTLAHNGPKDGSRDRAVINCGDTLHIPATQKGVIYMGGVTVNLGFPPGDPRDGVVIDSSMMLSLQFHGQVVYPGSGFAVVVRPTAPVPLDVSAPAPFLGPKPQRRGCTGLRDKRRQPVLHPHDRREPELVCGHLFRYDARRHRPHPLLFPGGEFWDARPPGQR